MQGFFEVFLCSMVHRPPVPQVPGSPALPAQPQVQQTGLTGGEPRGLTHLSTSSAEPRLPACRTAHKMKAVEPAPAPTLSS